MVAGQFYPMGKCDVVVSNTEVKVQNCNIASGWTTGKVHIYVGKTISTTCSPGQFGKPSYGGYTESYTTAKTGILPLDWSKSRTAGDPVYVMLHMEVKR
jgi:hypothetical protein